MATQLVHSHGLEGASSLLSTVNLQECYYSGLPYEDMQNNNHGQNPIRTQWRSPAVREVNHSMVCVDCFHSKGDTELQIPCQNPECRFYMQPPHIPDYGRNSSRRDAKGLASSYSVNVRPSTFNKEVGCNRQGEFTAQTFHPSQPSTSNCQVWAYPPVSPLGTRTLYSPQQNERPLKTVSHPLSLAGEGLDHIQPSSALQSDKVSLSCVLSQLKSMPVSGVNQLLEYDCGRAFENLLVPTPLPNPSGGEQNHKDSGGKNRWDMADTDIDSGISSPFGHPPCSLCASCSLPVKARDCTFDLSLLNAEINTCGSKGFRSISRMEEKGTESSVTCGLSTQDTLQTLLMSGQLSSLLNSTETYSRKVFVGGLPPDIDDEEIRSIFVHYGSLSVDWPHKLHTKACIPPKGYAFLLFKEECAVHKLLQSCFMEEDKYFVVISTSLVVRKKVEIRPWCISDSQYFDEAPGGLDLRKAIFVGGVPRPLKAFELSHVLEKKYGKVALVVIDCNSDIKYPKGAACVVFSYHCSYIKAVSARFMQLTFHNIDKKIEIKPYILDGQMCDECHGVQSGGKPAPFFCGSVVCLKYYCEYCWGTFHLMPGKQNHRPLQKDVGDKARCY